MKCLASEQGREPATYLSLKPEDCVCRQATAKARIPPGFDMNVSILTSGYWPTYPIQDAVLPEELSQSQARAATSDAQNPVTLRISAKKKNIPGRRAPRGAQPVAGARSHS